MRVILAVLLLFVMMSVVFAAENESINASDVLDEEAIKETVLILRILGAVVAVVVIGAAVYAGLRRRRLQKQKPL